MSPQSSTSLPPQLRVRALVLDVDGVMTPGGLIFGGEDESKTFNSRDGDGIRYFRRAGGKVALLTGRRSKAVERRAADLEVEMLVQDAKVKLPELHRISKELDVPLDEICYIGDDLIDLPCLTAVGLPVVVAGSDEVLCRAARCVTRNPGGNGAIREIVEWILKSQGKWGRIMERYEGGASR